MTTGEVTFGADFPEMEKAQKENEKSVKAIDKSLRAQAQMLSQAAAHMQKVLKGTMTQMGINNGVMTGPTGRGQYMGNMPQVLQIGQQMHLQQQIVNRQPIANSASSEFSAALGGAKVALAAFAATVMLAKNVMSNLSDAGSAGRDKGTQDVLSARAAKVLGGKAANYDQAFERMGSEERKQAMSFVAAAISRKDVQHIRTPLSAIEGGLSAIQRGRYTGDEATSLLMGGQLPMLSKERKGGFLTRENKLRAMEGNIEAQGRNSDYDMRAKVRLLEANRERLKLQNPGLFGVADTLTNGGASLAYAPHDLDAEINQGASPGVGRFPSGFPSGSPGGARSGDMGSQRGQVPQLVQALNALNNTIQKQQTSNARPPVEAGKN